MFETKSRPMTSMTDFHWNLFMAISSITTVCLQELWTRRILFSRNEVIWNKVTLVVSLENIVLS